MKKGVFTNLLLVTYLPIFLMNFVSAQFYNRYSLSSFLNTFDAQTVTLMSIFLIVFGIVFVVLIKSIFRDYRGIAVILSFAISFLTVFEMNRRGFSYSFENVFYGIGFSGDWGFIVPIIFLALMIFLIVKFGFGRTLFFFGLGLTLLMLFTEGLFYEEGLVLTIGIICLIVGMWLWRRSKGLPMYGSGATGWAVDKWKNDREMKIQQAQEEKERSQMRKGIRNRVHDLTNEIRRIDKEFKSVTSAISRANKLGNAQQVAILEQHRSSLRNQRREIESQIRQLRREHSGNL